MHREREREREKESERERERCDVILSCKREARFKEGKVVGRWIDGEKERLLV